jgi:gamma-glutamylcyclotransferase (GGCT)/AIG2-like uncharacterized protein YtfP
MKKTRYIAYGSNLNLPQMAHRCPTARMISPAILRGYRLLFRGERGGAVATVEPHEGDRVPVLVWEIGPEDEKALDRYEGFPWLYRKENVVVELDGVAETAMIYIMNGENYPLSQPGPGYYSTILEGYRTAGFDPEVLHRATMDSMEQED